MPLTADSTLAEIHAQYDDNADYDLTGSVSKAKLFIHACRLLLRRLTDSASKDGESFSVRYERIQKQLDEALSWWHANDQAASSGPSAVRHANFSEFRR